MNIKELERLEKVSEFYAGGDHMDELLVDREIELIRNLCRSRKNALEVGCGSGYSTAKLIDMFEHFEVIEPSVKNIAMMNSRLQRDVICHNTLLEDFQYRHKFDNIIFLNVLEHVEDPVGCLRCLESMLSDEGLIYISAPNCMSLNRRAGYKMGLLDSYATFAPKDYVLGHRRLYTVEMMREHVEQAGLKLMVMKGVYLKPLSEKQMIELGEDAVRAFYALGEDVPHYCANLFAVAGKKYYQSGGCC